MRSFRCASGLALLCVVAAGRAQGAPSATVSVRHVRAGQPRASVLGGVLSPPSTRPPAEVARAYLATAPEPLGTLDPATLRIDRVHAVPSGGATVELTQTHAGLDVVGATVAVRLDASGQVRWIAATTAPLPADLETTPLLDGPAAAAAVLAGPAAHYAGVTVPAGSLELVIWRPAPIVPARLAWRVQLPASLALMESLRYVVDARTGAILAVENLVDRDRQANVFPENPGKTPTITQVTLASLPVDAVDLSGPDFVGKSCIDDAATCLPVNINGTLTPIHGCGFTVRAVADANGDFLYDRPAADTDKTDAFAEVQIYYHAARVLEFFRGFGFANLNQRPMQAIANVLIANYQDLAGATCTGTPPVPVPGNLLQPLQNAAFFRARSDGSFPAEDMIIFGQGTSVDFSYDGDVVYHELGHAVMGTICPSYSRWVPDAFGLDLTPHGTNEGYADYFAMALTEDPNMAEYVGPGLGEPGALRTGENTKICPNDLWGEEHVDGEPWMGALWQIRAALAANGQAAAFDQAVYTVVDTLGMGSTPIGDTSSLLVAEVEATLGPTASATAQTIFAARGWDDCDDRVIDHTAPGATKDVLLLRGVNYLGMDTLVPGVVQFKIDVPERASSIGMVFQSSARPGSLVPTIPIPPQLKLLVKQDAPLQWTWTATSATPDTTAIGDIGFGINGGSGTVEGDFAPGTYYVQLANAGGSYYLVGISFNHVAAPPVPDAGVPDATPTPDAGTPEDGEGGGCGCHVAARDGAPGSRSHGATALLPLAGVAVISLRQRHRHRRRR